MQKKKLQGFFIYKINSTRLAKSKYNIQLDINDARRNGELVKLGDSTFLEVIRRVSNHPYSEEKIKNLKNIKKKNGDNLEISKEFDRLLHIDCLVEVSFENSAHYKKIFQKKGFILNGEKFVRILAGAANLRQQKIFFINEKYKKDVLKILNCGRNENQLFNIPKFEAYFGLYNSSGNSVSFPKFVVVPDAHFKRNVTVDWIDEQDNIINCNKEFEFNLFDGQGLISPKLSRAWALELGLDWIPSTWILRAPFLKGQFVTFDFLEFGKFVAKKEEIIDVWGDSVNVNDIDLVISESQFKLWQSYNNQKSYEIACHENKLGFRVTRYSQPFNKIKTYSNLNYMFIQVLDLDKNDVEKLCQPTIEYFNDLSGANRNKMLSYLYPDNIDVDFESVEPEIQALMLDEEFSKEPSVQRKFVNSLKKRIKESYLGNILVHGNYQAMISDPYAQAEHIFGLEIMGLLDEGENYSRFWNEEKVELVGGARSPLTHFSEFNKCKMVDNCLLKDWYSYIDNGFVLNVKGFDTLLYADSDFDGDLIFTTANKIILKGIRGGFPISYNRKKVSKKEINDDNISESDLFSFGGKIGFITNVSSTFHCMLKDFDEGTPEYKELQKRLKILRMNQGAEIDSAKGLEKKPIPPHWTKYQKVTEDMPEEEKKIIKFNNSLIAEKRPRFFRHLYHHLSAKYREKDFERNFWAYQFGKSFDDLKNDVNLSKEEADGIEYYARRFPFIENSSVMNMVEKTMMDGVRENQVKIKKDRFNYEKILKNRYPSEWVEKYYKEYKYLKRVYRHDENYKQIENVSKIIKENILSNVSGEMDYILDCVIKYFYEDRQLSDTGFVWIFGDEIVNRLLETRNTYNVPEKLKDEISKDSFDYLWSKYHLKKVSVEKNEKEI